MNIGIIPARGGSKRIPGKNIKPFAGKPIIGWVIEAATASGLFERIIVSTDDNEIAAVAVEHGAEVPFLRPPELADDHTGIVEVVQHAIAWMREENIPAEHVCCMLATAPFLQPDVLSQALERLIESQAEYAFSVTGYGFPVQRAIRINSDGRVEALSPENNATRSQDLEEVYHDAGQFYWGTTQAWVQGKAIFSTGSVPIRLPRYRVQDIDTDEDWTRAELMFNALMESGELGP